VDSASDNLKRTPLHAAHVALGAKLVPFGGWEMPVQYTSIREEHLAVRSRVGLFDVSHMGQFLVAGPHAERVLNRLLTNDVRRLAVGQAQYTLLCHEQGGVVDDLIAYRLEPSVFLLVVNASRIAADWHWIETHADAPVVLENQSDATGMIAVQGPAAAQLLPAFADLPAFHSRPGQVAGVTCRVARTGYTGEDGFELLCAAADTEQLWQHFVAAGAAPCGLGARDTLRLEACLPLYGHELTEQTTPLEAGLGRWVAFDKGEFMGRAVLAKQKEKGVNRRLIAFRMPPGSPPPRAQYAIWSGGQRVGEVTSGAPSPSLGVGIGLGYVAAGVTQIEIEIRGKLHTATMEKKPLVKRKS